MPFNLAEAGAAVGRDKSTILKAIQKGTISATRAANGHGWLIEPAELHRVFPPVADTTTRTGPGNAESGEVRELRAEVRELREAIRFRDETLADLRRRLDAEAEARRQEAEERRRLTDQRAAPARRWWRFGR